MEAVKNVCAAHMHSIIFDEWMKITPLPPQSKCVYITDENKFSSKEDLTSPPSTPRQRRELLCNEAEQEAEQTCCDPNNDLAVAPPPENVRVLDCTWEQLKAIRLTTPDLLPLQLGVSDG